MKKPAKLKSKKPSGAKRSDSRSAARKTHATTETRKAKNESSVRFQSYDAQQLS